MYSKRTGMDGLCESETLSRTVEDPTERCNSNGASIPCVVGFFQRSVNSSDGCPDCPNGVLPANGNQPSIEMQFDSSDTERALGFKLQGFDEQVMSAVNHYLEELAKPGAKPVQGYWDGDECFAA